MKEIVFDLKRTRLPLRIPESSEVLGMGAVPALTDPQNELLRALRNPIGSPPLNEMIRQKLIHRPQARAVIVISDNTRPVPYRDGAGILSPLIDEILQAGVPPDRLTLLVATGTHHAMSDADLREVLDPCIFDRNIKIFNHDCRQRSELKSIGRSRYECDILVNRYYLESDIKILTGLVESHFMAGVSGGRKSICPGLLGEESTFILHSGPILSSPRAADMILEGNPVHEECLAAAKTAGCDFIVNVTLDSEYAVTGIFAGELDRAHRAAYEFLKSYITVPFDKLYDLVITHAGFVGINHYQAAKGALACLPLLRPGGAAVLAADHPDKDPVGGANYRAMLKRLGEWGPERFLQEIIQPGWKFVPEQWEAQMWGKLFRVISPQDFLYCTLDIPREDFTWIPGRDARSIFPHPQDLSQLTNAAVKQAVSELRSRLNREPRIAVLPDGPYAIPIKTISKH